MNLYGPEPELEPGSVPAVGILLANLGSPEAPTAPALRRFLREFLSDPRVIELARWKWLPILNLFVLPFRPRVSAALYRKIWREDGSPLLNRTLRLGESLATALAGTAASPLHVAVGMRYGQPSIPQALAELRQRGCTKLLVVPMFPQYSGTTVASIFDAVVAELSTWRVVPSVRTVHRYHDEPAYISELAASIDELWTRDGKPERLLFSFHGIPLRYAAAGDPYQDECVQTAQLVADELRLTDQEYVVAFQSIFGREKWITPATDVTVRAMAEEGVKRLDVICPGFSVDCLETLEEIDQLNRGYFLDGGGERFRYVPCLNDRPGHSQMLAGLSRRNLEGWLATVGPEGLRHGMAS